ncbi:non-homologous end joining protein Ku [Alicyclobacillus contaminans]|nr:non-homologous end joining protein Ku [Alicyclobacillus contaminans]
MHTMWKGSISFGLVNVPVRMFAATESKDVKFRYLHKECKTPIQYTRTCPRCNRPVEWDEIVRGFEYAPDQYVVFDPDELSAVQRKRSQTIDIVDFVELTEIDPVYYDKTYYLAPETAGVKAYRLLEQAMGQTHKIAIAKTVLRNRETLACIRTGPNSVIIMETLYWPDEVRGVEELPNLRAETQITAQELTMAVTLIEQMSTSFQPEKYVDEHRAELEQLIERKVANDHVTQPPAAAARADNIVDLMQALQESLNQKQAASSKKKAAASTRRRTKKTS